MMYIIKLLKSDLIPFMALRSTDAIKEIYLRYKLVKVYI